MQDSNTRQYMNINLDTFWLVDRADWPDFWGMFCPQCGNEQLFLWDSVREPHHQLKRLALSFNRWHDPDASLADLANKGRSRGVGPMNVIRSFNGTKELLIVVGKDPLATPKLTRRDVVFVEPTRSPYNLLGHSTFHNLTGSTAAGLDLQIDLFEIMNSWRLMEQRLEKILHYFKKRRGEMRKHEVEGKAPISTYIEKH